MYGSPYFATRFAYVSLLQKYFAINCLSSIRLKSSMTFFVTVLIDSTLFKNISITSIKAVEYLAKNKKKMTSGSAQRKPLPGGYHLLLSYYLAVRLRVSPRDFHPHLSIFLEKDEPWMSRTSKPNNFVAWSQPVGFPLLLIIRFVKSAQKGRAPVRAPRLSECSSVGTSFRKDTMPCSTLQFLNPLSQ